MTFSVTPHGVLACIPTVEVGDLLCADLSWTRTQSNNRDITVYLVLLWRKSAPIPFFDIGCYGGVALDTYQAVRRLFQWVEPPNRQGAGRKWRQVYLTAYHEASRYRGAIPMLCVPINHALDHPVRIPERQLRIFMDAERLELLSIKNAQIPWDGSKPTIITFCGTAGRGRVRIVLKTGKCQRDVRRLDAASPHKADMWANIHACLDRVEAVDGAQHVCPDDHIEMWPALTRRFSSRLRTRHAQMEYSFTMSFARCPLRPHTSVVLKSLSLRCSNV